MGDENLGNDGFDQVDQVEEMFDDASPSGEAGKVENVPASKEEVPHQDEPAAETPKDGPKESSAAEMIAEFRKELSAIRAELASANKPVEEKEGAKEETPAEAFFTADEYKEALTSPNKLNELFARVYERARQDTLRDAAEVAAKSVQRQASVQTLVGKFWAENPELEGVKPYVQWKISQLEAEHPDKEYSELLGLAAKAAYADLKIEKQAQDQEKARQDPAFAEAKGGQRRQSGGEGRTPEQKEIDELVALDY